MMKFDSAGASPILIASIIAGYFLILMLLSRLTSGKSDNKTFFTANRNAPWYLVAFGMIGTSISGVTFVSVPGAVGATPPGSLEMNAFSYFQVVIGYFLGYIVIAQILLPLYYRLNLTSIYTYLEQRFGFATYKTGAFFFLISRTAGSALRLLLAAKVFQVFIFDAWGFPFEYSVIICMILILLYSIKGGIKTIIWTDTLQTFFLVLSLILTILFISNDLGFSLGESLKAITDSPRSKIFFTDVNSPNFFVKQILAGMFITITMTGLDQDLMQKNLTCRNLGEAKKNMLVFSFILVGVNLLFLGLGSLLYTYAQQKGIALPGSSDELFPTIALKFFPLVFSIVFLIGLTAATFASTDSAITALTTSFCVDFLGFEKEGHEHKVSTRYLVHISFAIIVVITVLSFYHYSGGGSIIGKVLRYAGYTYGPLLGLYAFGLYSRRRPVDIFIPIICVVAPVLTFLLEKHSGSLFNGYQIGFETILINGILVWAGLWALSLNRGKLAA